MRSACDEAGTAIVAGDTKVMRRGEVDRLVINTSGVGMTHRVIRDRDLVAGDVLIVTGTIGDHGMAVMAARHQFEFREELRSDVAPLNGLIRLALLAGGPSIHAMKPPAYGGSSDASTVASSSAARPASPKRASANARSTVRDGSWGAIAWASAIRRT